MCVCEESIEYHVLVVTRRGRGTLHVASPLYEVLFPWLLAVYGFNRCRLIAPPPSPSQRACTAVYVGQPAMYADALLSNVPRFDIPIESLVV